MSSVHEKRYVSTVQEGFYLNSVNE